MTTFTLVFHSNSKGTIRSHSLVTKTKKTENVHVESVTSPTDVLNVGQIPVDFPPPLGKLQLVRILLHIYTEHSSTKKLLIPGHDLRVHDTAILLKLGRSNSG